ncbi:hypothetical protein RA8CHR_02578 [Variovorax sp. RA8]|nr:hypothetical protein RA8CHR_02578 [Variovorax sp. RA8]
MVARTLPSASSRRGVGKHRVSGKRYVCEDITTKYSHLTNLITDVFAALHLLLSPHPGRGLGGGLDSGMRRRQQWRYSLRPVGNIWRGAGGEQQRRPDRPERQRRGRQARQAPARRTHPARHRARTRARARRACADRPGRRPQEKDVGSAGGHFCWAGGAGPVVFRQQLADQCHPRHPDPGRQDHELRHRPRRQAGRAALLRRLEPRHQRAQPAAAFHPHRPLLQRAGDAADHRPGAARGGRHTRPQRRHAGEPRRARHQPVRPAAAGTEGLRHAHAIRAMVRLAVPAGGRPGVDRGRHRRNRRRRRAAGALHARVGLEDAVQDRQLARGLVLPAGLPGA